MDLRQQIYDLLRNIGPGQMMTTAYDTAWIARLGEIGEPIGEQALQWLRANQLEDGSWGAKEPYYHHDRVICTLAAMNAIARRARTMDRPRLQRAELALEQAISGLQTDPVGETVGFELIVPTLLHEAKALGGIHNQENKVLQQLAPKRAAKLSALPDGIVNRSVTVAFSSEMAGTDKRDLLDIDNLQEPDGSIAVSPSATAYFVICVRRRDEAALNYLHTVVDDGEAPNVYPFDVFEQAWVLWNLALTSNMDSHMIALIQPSLNFLKSAWIPGQGVGFAANYTPNDGDDTGLVFEVLSRFGYSVDLEALLRYEHVYYFRCFNLESSPSVSANIHILGALKQSGLGKNHPSVEKILKFLSEIRKENTFWLDKWHASPYYATTQAIAACSGYTEDLVKNAIHWILATQNKDGSWGYYMPTAEETAYCIQALKIWERLGYKVPDNIFRKSALWLKEHMDQSYPPLWIGKCLYCPELVVRSAILSALLLTECD